MKFCIAAKADDHDKGEKRRMMRSAWQIGFPQSSEGRMKEREKI